MRVSMRLYERRCSSSSAHDRRLYRNAGRARFRKKCSCGSRGRRRWKFEEQGRMLPRLTSRLWKRAEPTMSLPPPSIIDTRRNQMFPVLEPVEIERVRRFGKVRSYGAGEALAKAGEKGHGLAVILTGTVEITQHDESGRRELIVTPPAGAVTGELAASRG